MRVHAAFAGGIVRHQQAVLRAAGRSAHEADDIANLSFISGKTNRQISDRMCLAEKTVKNYGSALLHKLGRERRTQAAVLATRLMGPTE